MFIFKIFNLLGIFSKCTYIGHKWKNYSVPIKYKLNFQIRGSLTKDYNDILDYRECERCKRKESKKRLFMGNWKEVYRRPKQIRPYLNKYNLTIEEKKELNEYLKNVFH